ncbi:MAG: hypothetical protein JRJ44_01510 [Deltaproteobacteria bacterium]|nr:hypothetical protein [Deltaproteobacteria bacterium]
MKIFFYAFTNITLFFNEVIKEAQLKKEHIEWGLIFPKAVYKKSADKIVKKKNILYLYENFNKIYQKTDSFDFEFKTQENSIYKIIKSSKNNFTKVDSKKQLKIAKTTYVIYKDFLLKNRPDYIVFSLLETVDGFILINLCYELGIEPIYCYHTRVFGKQIFGTTVYQDLPVYYGGFEEKDTIEAKKFIDDFYQGNIAAFETVKEWTNTDKVKIEKEKFLKRTIKSLFCRFVKGENKCLDIYSIPLQIKRNLTPFIYKYRKIIYNSYHKNLFHIKTDQDILPENFILYALQKTPEASINTLEPYFVKQERAIELLLLNMPSNFYLLVKEHPVMEGERPASFYKKMRAQPGVLLVDPNVSTNKLVKKAKLVCSVTGTIGLECYLANKPCLLFGKNFFNRLCYSFSDFHNFKNDLYKMIFEYKPPSLEEKIEEIAKIYNVSYSYTLNDPFFVPHVMEKENIKHFLKYIKEHIKRFETHKEDQTALNI